MGTFRTTVGIAAYQSDPRHVLEAVTVDPDVLYSWLPSDVLVAAGIKPERTEQFETRDGRIVERTIGFAMLYVASRLTLTVVVFGEPADRTVLGALALSGLNLRVDAHSNNLVDAGPIIVGAAA